MSYPVKVRLSIETPDGALAIVALNADVAPGERTRAVADQLICRASNEVLATLDARERLDP